MTQHCDRRSFLKNSVLALGATGLSVEPTASRAVGLFEKPSWIERSGKVYGAKPDNKGPVGGASGYLDIVTKGDFEVDDFDGLVNALKKAGPGQTVFIKGEAEIDLTADVYIDDFFLEIPAGVTLAGNRGHNGSAGAIITSDALKTTQMIKPLGPGVRITGIRLKGPNPKRYMRHHTRAFGEEKRGSSYYYKFPTSNGIVCDTDRLTVDNCEITAFAHSGIYLKSGAGHHLHHNYIHHCQYHGLGYGVSHNKSESIIEFNLFDANRHSIAGTGAAESSYTARYNVESGTASSHCFDMHGGRDRKDGTNIAGKNIRVYGNTFYVPQQRAVVIRGEPVETCEVYQNWFVYHDTPAGAVRGEEKTRAFDNLYGEDNPKII